MTEPNSTFPGADVQSESPAPAAERARAKHAKTLGEEIANAITHGIGSALAIAALAVLIAYGALADSAWAIVGSAIYGATLIVTYVSSTLYHSLLPGKPKRVFLALDHCGIFFLIAGTYTPVALIGLHGAWTTTVLAVVWSGAALAALTKVCWVGAPKWLSAALGIALGWVAVVALPELAHNEGLAPLFLLAAGGLAYTAGAVVYASGRPDPLPRVFGYHELFHALTIIALSCQYVAIAVFIVRVT